MAIAASLVYGIFSPSAKRPPRPAAEDVSSGVDTLDWLTVPARTARRTSADTWGKNPMVVKETFSGETISGFTLSGILWDKTKPTAIVNDQIVEKGSRLGDFVVIDIQKDRVSLDDGQDKIDLRLG